MKKGEKAGSLSPTKERFGVNKSIVNIVHDNFEITP